MMLLDSYTITGKFVELTLKVSEPYVKNTSFSEKCGYRGGLEIIFL